MKKLLFICGICLAVSAMALDRASEMVASIEAGQNLTRLASIYHRSDPYLLTTAFTTEAQPSSVGKARRSANVQPKSTSSREVDLADYVFLHYTRVESAPPAEKQQVVRSRR